jgi:hypothetical protein
MKRDCEVKFGLGTAWSFKGMQGMQGMQGWEQRGLSRTLWSFKDLVVFQGPCAAHWQQGRNLQERGGWGVTLGVSRLGFGVSAEIEGEGGGDGGGRYHRKASRCWVGDQDLGFEITTARVHDLPQQGYTTAAG